MTAPRINLRSNSQTTARTAHWTNAFRGIWVLGAIAALLAGCTTKAKAKAGAREAFLAGQQQAMIRMQQQVQGTNISIVGHVRNPLIPWSEELTVAKALVAAGYLGARDPREIIVVRSGRATTIETKNLLNGEDIPLFPGDVIQLVE
jgi:hypothetical protein